MKKQIKKKEVLTAKIFADDSMRGET